LNFLEKKSIICNIKKIKILGYLVCYQTWKTQRNNINHNMIQENWKEYLQYPANLRESYFSRRHGRLVLEVIGEL